MRRSREISPQFSYRFDIADIRKFYGDLEAAMAAGDYNLVATYAPVGSELKGCALVLSGLYVSGLPILEGRATLSDFGKLCLGFGLWLSDRHGAATATLSLVERRGPYGLVAQKLMRLIETQDISVFTISVTLPIFTAESEKARRPILRYGQFLVKHVGTQLEKNAYDSEYKPTEPLDEFIDRLPAEERPLFIWSMSPQAVLPKNYEKVKLPKLMWCHDTDIFLYRGYDNFRLNDINIVSTSQEHFELSRALGTPVVSNIMSDTLCMPSGAAHLPEQKDIDLLLTGSTVVSFHSEKARFTYQLSKLSDEFNIVVVDGHLPEDTYLSLVKRSHFVPIANRYAGATSPRWREGLSAGAMLLYPEGTPYSEITPGTFSYRAATMETDIRHHLRMRRDTGHMPGSPYNAAEVFPRIDAGLAFLRDAREKQVERQFKFNTFMLLLHETEAGTVSVPDAHRRLTWYVPPVDGKLWTPQNVKPRMLAIGDALVESDFLDEKDYNNAALLYEQLNHFPGVSEAERVHCEARKQLLLEQGLSRYPDSLLLNFNAAHWAFMDAVCAGGVPGQPALSGFQSVIDRGAQLTFDPICSDFGVAYTLLHRDAVFPYYDYGQTFLKQLVRQNTPGYHPPEALADLKDIVLAAAHGYLGWGCILAAPAGNEDATRRALEHFERSLAIYDDNLPLKRLRFECLVRAYRPNGDQTIAASIVDSYLDYAEKLPAALLTDIHLVLPSLDEKDDADALRYLLSEWHRYERSVGFAEPEDLEAVLRKGTVIMRYEKYFPQSLRQSLKLWREGGTSLRKIGQPDRAMGHPVSVLAADPVIMIRRLVELEAELVQTRTDLSAILNSRSWKLTGALRALRGVILKTFHH
ncbi:hypothetical protein [Ferrovibrio terrae]|uniref:hypothetical protein n=1 Tax=Ferrovibrio terrae TaxID=2594003 RepID=UPI003138186A